MAYTSYSNPDSVRYSPRGMAVKEFGDGEDGEDEKLKDRQRRKDKEKKKEQQAKKTSDAFSGVIAGGKAGYKAGSTYAPALAAIHPALGAAAPIGGAVIGAVGGGALGYGAGGETAKDVASVANFATDRSELAKDKLKKSGKRVFNPSPQRRG